MTDMTTNLRLEEYRRQNKERIALLRRGDISTALSSISMLWQTYTNMADDLKKTLSIWSDIVKLQRKETDEGLRTMERFNNNAEKLMGDSLRVVLRECGVAQDEIADVEDDTKYCALLNRIANAGPMEAMRIAENAYMVASKVLGGYASKIIGLKNRSIETGSSGAEVMSANAIIPKLERAAEIVKRRKDTMLELNLKYKREIGKFIEKHTIDPLKGRELTEEEKEILKGLK